MIKQVTYAVAPTLTGWVGGYGAGAYRAKHKSQLELQNNGFKHSKRAGNMALGSSVGAAYLSLTPAGQRPMVNRGVASARFASGFYSGHTYAHRKELTKRTIPRGPTRSPLISNDKSWKTRTRKYGKTGRRK